MKPTTNSTNPSLRFPKFNDVWKLKKLSDCISTLDAGVSVNSENRPMTVNEKGILKTSCVTNGYFDSRQNKVVSNHIEKERLKENVKRQTIIISRMNTPELVGANALVKNDYPNLYLPDRLWAAKIKSNTNPNWLAYYLGNSQSRFKISSKATGTSNSMKNITKHDLLSLYLYTPSLPEQQKIASFLTSVDDWIINLRTQKEQLETYKRGLMQKLFTQTLRFRDENGEEYPEWKVIKAEEIFDNYTNKDHQGDLPLLAVTQENGVVYRNDLDLKINSSTEGIKNYKIIEKDTFIISLRSFQGGIEHSTIKGISSPAYTILKNKIAIDHRFYAYYFKTRDFINKLGTLIYGIRDGKQISYKDFKSMRIIYPSPYEQQKIATFLTSIDQLIDSKDTQIKSAEKWKRGLLQKMFV